MEYYTHAMQDNSTSKLKCVVDALKVTPLLKFESHYPPLCGIVQLTNSVKLHFMNWSFTIIYGT